jgi:hypothetical protein
MSNAFVRIKPGNDVAEQCSRLMPHREQTRPLAILAPADTAASLLCLRSHFANRRGHLKVLLSSCVWQCND